MRCCMSSEAVCITSRPVERLLCSSRLLIFSDCLPFAETQFAVLRVRIRWLQAEGQEVICMVLILEERIVIWTLPKRFLHVFPLT